MPIAWKITAATLQIKRPERAVDRPAQARRRAGDRQGWADSSGRPRRDRGPSSRRKWAASAPAITASRALAAAHRK